MKSKINTITLRIEPDTKDKIIILKKKYALNLSAFVRNAIDSEYDRLKQS
jgi:hypothetical protein